MANRNSGALISELVNALQSSLAPYAPSTLNAAPPKLNSAAAIDSMLGSNLNRSQADIFSELANVINAAYASSMNDQDTSEHRYVQQLGNVSDTAIDALKGQYAADAATGVNQGMQAANVLSAILGMQNNSIQGMNELFGNRSKLLNQKATDMANASSQASTTHSTMQQYLADFAKSLYETDSTNHTTDVASWNAYIDAILGSLPYYLSNYDDDENNGGSYSGGNYSGGSGLPSGSLTTPQITGLTTGNKPYDAMGNAYGANGAPTYNGYNGYYTRNPVANTASDIVHKAAPNRMSALKAQPAGAYSDTALSILPQLAAGMLAPKYDPLDETHRNSGMNLRQFNPNAGAAMKTSSNVSPKAVGPSGAKQATVPSVKSTSANLLEALNRPVQPTQMQAPQQNSGTVLKSGMITNAMQAAQHNPTRPPVLNPVLPTIKPHLTPVSTAAKKAMQTAAINKKNAANHAPAKKTSSNVSKKAVATKR